MGKKKMWRNRQQKKIGKTWCNGQKRVAGMPHLLRFQRKYLSAETLVEACVPGLVPAPSIPLPPARTGGFFFFDFFFYFSAVEYGDFHFWEHFFLLDFVISPTVADWTKVWRVVFFFFAFCTPGTSLFLSKKLFVCYTYP